jgi:TPR repeat protein
VVSSFVIGHDLLMILKAVAAVIVACLLVSVVWKRARSGKRDRDRAVRQAGYAAEAHATKAKKAVLKAHAGDAEAQNALGNGYATGDGVEVNQSAAVEWYRKAALQGHAEAQLNLATCYDTGEGVARDEKEAIKWYLAAADQGVAEAQYNAALKLLSGDGVEKDTEKGSALLLAAADQGLEEAKDAIARSKLK